MAQEGIEKLLNFTLTDRSYYIINYPVDTPQLHIQHIYIALNNAVSTSCQFFEFLEKIVQYTCIFQ